MTTTTINQPINLLDLILKAFILFFLAGIMLVLIILNDKIVKKLDAIKEDTNYTTQLFKSIENDSIAGTEESSKIQASSK